MTIIRSPPFEGTVPLADWLLEALPEAIVSPYPLPLAVVIAVFMEEAADSEAMRLATATDICRLLDSNSESIRGRHVGRGDDAAPGEVEEREVELPPGVGARRGTRRALDDWGCTDIRYIVLFPLDTRAAVGRSIFGKTCASSQWMNGHIARMYSFLVVPTTA